MQQNNNNLTKITTLTPTKLDLKFSLSTPIYNEVIDFRQITQTFITLSCFSWLVQGESFLLVTRLLGSVSSSNSICWIRLTWKHLYSPLFITSHDVIQCFKTPLLYFFHISRDQSTRACFLEWFTNSVGSWTNFFL